MNKDGGTGISNGEGGGPTSFEEYREKSKAAGFM